MSDKPNYPLMLEAGEDSLIDTIHQLHGTIVQARTPSQSPNLSLPLLSKAAAGLGKTSQLISELCVGQIKHKQTVQLSIMCLLIIFLYSSFKTLSRNTA